MQGMVSINRENGHYILNIKLVSMSFWFIMHVYFQIKEEIAMRELLEQDHREKMECLRKENVDMKQVVAQYEKTIVELTGNTSVCLGFPSYLFLNKLIRAKRLLNDLITQLKPTN